MNLKRLQKSFQRKQKKRFKEPTQFNKNIRGMIETIKNIEVKDEINFEELRLSTHSFIRIKQRLKIKNRKKALEYIKELLQRATRIGEQVAFDGSVNILYACDKVAIYLSPCLSYIVTVNYFPEVFYDKVLEALPSLEEQYQGEELRQKLLELHLEIWDEIEKEEKAQEEFVFKAEEDTNEEINRLRELVEFYDMPKLTKGYRTQISELRYRLKIENRRLFEIKARKRQVSKSLVSVI